MPTRCVGAWTTCWIRYTDTRAHRSRNMPATASPRSSWGNRCTRCTSPHDVKSAEPVSRPPFRHPVWYLLAGHFLLGLAHVAMLPPWEGFDETAHYSYLQQLADTRTLPRWGDRMSKAVEEYAFAAPLPYT